MSTETVWSLIIGSLSVGLGWVLNEVSQIFRSLGENRRIKKRVLHDLLEINFVLSSLDFKPIVDLIMFKLSKELQIKFTNEDKESFNDFIHKTLYTNIEKNVIDELDEIDESYLNSVLELSKVDPIRAYYLRNKTRLFDYLENVEEQWSSSLFSQLQKTQKQAYTSPAEKAGCLFLALQPVLPEFQHSGFHLFSLPVHPSSSVAATSSPQNPQYRMQWKLVPHSIAFFLAGGLPLLVFGSPAKSLRLRASRCF